MLSLQEIIPRQVKYFHSTNWEETKVDKFSGKYIPWLLLNKHETTQVCFQRVC